MITQLSINSLIVGSIYALVAAGFSLIYATNKFVHFGHGASVAASSYCAYLLFNILGLPFPLSCTLTILFSGVLGYSMYRGVYDRLITRNSSNVILLIASVGILILIENLILLGFGADVKSYNYIPVSQGLTLFGANITPLQIVVVSVSVMLMLGLYYFMSHSRLGRQMRAVADNKELASIVGIPEKKVAAKSFVLGSMIAGVAGILIGLEQNLNPSMGTMLMVKGFTGAVIGGVTSVPAAIAGSYLLGFAENFGIWWLPSGYKDAIAFVLLFVFLLWRPSGIFGVDKGVKG